jgi:hypothetical protein
MQMQQTDCRDFLANADCFDLNVVNVAPPHSSPMDFVCQSQKVLEFEHMSQNWTNLNGIQTT